MTTIGSAHSAPSLGKRPTFKLTRWTLSTRLTAGFLFVAAIFVATATPLLLDLDAIETGMVEIIDQRLESSETAGRLLNDINRSMSAMRGWILSNDREFIRQFQHARIDINSSEARMERIARTWKEREDYKVWSDIRTQLADFRAVLAEIERTELANQPSRAIHLMKVRAQPQAESVIRSLRGTIGENEFRSGGLINRLRQRAIADEVKIHDAINSHALYEWAFLIIALALTGLAAHLTTRSVVPPLESVTAAMSRLAAGDDTIEIPGIERSDEIGRMAHALAVFRDNAIERRQLLTQFRNIADNFPGIIYSRSHFTDGTVSMGYVSPGIKQLTGVDASEFKADFQNFIDLVHPEDLAEWQALIAQPMPDDMRRSYEIRLRDPAGGARWWKIVEQAQTGDDGTVSWDGAALDITQQKETEGALLQSEWKFRSIVDTAIDGIITINDQGVIETINPAAEKIFGFTGEELSGKNVSVLMPPFDRSRHDAYLNNFRSTGERKIIGIGRELVGQRKNGDTFAMDLSVSEPYGDGEKKFTGVIRDISERKILEEQLRQSLKMEALGNLAGGVAHDFNNTLFPIITIAEVLIDGLDESSGDRKHLEKIVMAAKHGRDVVRQILKYSRQQPIDLKSTNLPKIVEEATNFLKAAIPTTTKIITAAEPGVEQVLADSTQLYEVIINLGTNAGYAIGNQTGKIGINLSREDVGETANETPAELPSGPYAVLSVTDTGSGMDEKTMARIFDPYFTTKPAGEGTGLGLATVQGIIASHNGTIIVDSKPGHGARFKIYLPLVEPPDGAETDHRSETREPHPA